MLYSYQSTLGPTRANGYLATVVVNCPAFVPCLAFRLKIAGVVEEIQGAASWEASDGGILITLSPGELSDTGTAVLRVAVCGDVDGDLTLELLESNCPQAGQDLVNWPIAPTGRLGNHLPGQGQGIALDLSPRAFRALSSLAGILGEPCRSVADGCVSDWADSHDVHRLECVGGQAIDGTRSVDTHASGEESESNDALTDDGADVMSRPLPRGGRRSRAVLTEQKVVRPATRQRGRPAPDWECFERVILRGDVLFRESVNRDHDNVEIEMGADWFRGGKLPT